MTSFSSTATNGRRSNRYANQNRDLRRCPIGASLIAYEPKTTHGHELIIENFADAILHGADLIAPAEEGLNSVAINNAIILSAHKRQTVELAPR